MSKLNELADIIEANIGGGLGSGRLIANALFDLDDDLPDLLRRLRGQVPEDFQQQIEVAYKLFVDRPSYPGAAAPFDAGVSAALAALGVRR